MKVTFSLEQCFSKGVPRNSLDVSRDSPGVLRDLLCVSRDSLAMPLNFGDVVMLLVKIGKITLFSINTVRGRRPTFSLPETHLFSRDLQ